MFENISTHPPAKPNLLELTRQAQELAAQVAATQARLVDLAAQIAECRELDCTPRQWLAWQCGLTTAEAARVVALAERLPKLPGIAEALVSGRLSEGTVSSMARVATPDNESLLLKTAEVATGAQLQVLLRRFRSVKDAEDPAPEREETVGYGYEPDGMWRMSALLHPERGAEVEAAFRALKDEARRTDPPPPGNLADGQRASEHGYMSNAEALVTMTERVLRGVADPDGVVLDRYLTIVHVSEVGSGHLHGGPAVDGSVVDQACCEGSVMTLVERDGEPVTVTSPTRLANRAQRRALLSRDVTCRFPGCGRTSSLRAHHVIHHQHGGPTRLDNLVLLCQFHHSLVHRPGYQVRRLADGTLEVTRPDGTIAGARPDPPSERPAEPGPAGEPRSTGANDPLTGFAIDVILHDWLDPPEGRAGP